ncbi:MAG: hypothetical protein NVS4B7_04770 [Ktedonobacteraceae bacterium]
MYQEEYSNYRVHSPSYGGHKPTSRHWRHWRRWLVAGILVLALVLVWLQPFSVMSSYVGLDGNPVVQMDITPTRIPQTMSVHLILPAKDGEQADTFDCYVKPGDTLTLDGGVLHFAPVLNMVGLHSGYKSTALKGCSLDPKHKVMTTFILNAGGDGFFSWLQGQKWLSFLAEAHNDKPFVLQIGSTAQNFTVYTSQQGLHARATN